MKKVLIGIAFILSIIMIVQQLRTNEYASAKKLAESGNYQAFYAEIKNDVTKGDKDAADVLIEYFHNAVHTGDIVESKFYLDQDRSLINKTDEIGARAMDAALSADVVRLDMLKLLLEYQPELNYQLPYYKNFSPLQTIALSNDIKNGSLITELLIDHGANINYRSEKDDEASYSALSLSYLSNTSEVFKTLLQHGASMKVEKKMDDDHNLLTLITGSYINELQKHISNLKKIYSSPLSSEVLSIIKSPSYRVLHQKNLGYLTVIFETKELDELDEFELLKLAQYYAITNEVDGMKLLVEHGLCTFSSICEDAIQKARLNNNTEIEKLIQGK